MNAAPQSFVSWIISALGLGYLVLIPSAAIIAFVIALIVVIRGRGPMAAAALVLVTPAPFLIGLIGALEGVISSYSIIATSAATPRPSELAQGISMALVAPLTGLLLMTPALVVAAFGAFYRSISDDEKPAS